MIMIENTNDLHIHLITAATSMILLIAALLVTNSTDHVKKDSYIC